MYVASCKNVDTEHISKYSLTSYFICFTEHLSEKNKYISNLIKVLYVALT